MTPELVTVYTYHEGADGLPAIMVAEEGDYLHYPASPADITAVLRQLPREMLDGLQDVSLQFEPELYDPDEHTRTTLITDPYYGRLGAEWLPGVYSASCLGEYVPIEQSVVLLGFVYNPVMPDRAMWESYLRFVALSNLMHEVAHHVDYRQAHGMNCQEWVKQAEYTAERDQEIWTAQYVVPYLLQAYPEDTSLLLRWIEQYAGTSVTLPELIAEPSIHGYLINRHSLVCEMAHLVASGASVADTHLFYLHFLLDHEEDEKALPLIEQFIIDFPDHTKAKVLMASLWE